MNTLSAYQQAILTELGVSQWQLRKPLTDEIVTQKPSVDDVVPTDKVIALPEVVAPVAENEQQSQPKDIAGKALLLMPATQAQFPLVQDVLQWLQPEPEVHIASDSSLSEYTNFSLAWQLGDKLMLEDNCLTTPPVAELMASPDLKKQLWKILS